MRFSRIKNSEIRTMMRLPRLGKIRLGLKVKKAGTDIEYPKETEYFVVPDEVKAKVGDKPRELRVMLPTEDEEQVFRQYYAVYGGNHAIQCQGDGEQAERREFKQVGDQQVATGKQMVPCPGPDTCEYSLSKGKGGKPGCKARMDLMVVLPDVSMGGVYQLSSGSVNTDVDIRSGIQMARVTLGRISWVPMVLRRTEQLIPDPGTGKMMKHFPVSIEHLVKLEEIAAFKKDNDRVFLLAQKTEVAEPVVEGEIEAAVIEAESTTDSDEGIDVDWSDKARAGYIADLNAAPDKSSLDHIAKSLTPLKGKFLPADYEAIRLVYQQRSASFRAAKSETVTA